MSLVAREAWLPVDMASSPKRADPPRGLPHASPSGASDASAEDWVVAMHSADDASGSAVRRPRCIVMKSCYFHRRMLCHLSLQYPFEFSGIQSVSLLHQEQHAHIPSDPDPKILHCIAWLSFLSSTVFRSVHVIESSRVFYFAFQH